MSLAVEEERAGKAERLWHLAGGWRGVGTAVGIFAFTRLGQLILLAWLDSASLNPVGVRDRLLVWDAGWFLRVAVDGYPSGYTVDSAGVVQGNELAFFPVYPMLIRFVATLGADPHTAAIAVSWLASLAAAVALHLLGTTLYGRRTGWALVAICCSAPVSVVFSMAYSEGVFLALVAGMLVAAHRRVWWAAGPLGLLAALTRPTGAAAAVALAVAALLAIRESREKAWQPLGAAALALAGVPLFLAWVGWRVGDPAAWFRIQAAGWGTSFDFGASTLSFLASTLSTGEGWVPISVAFILLAAVAAARARPRVAVLSIVAWAAFGLWYGAYLVAVWPYTL